MKRFLTWIGRKQRTSAVSAHRSRTFRPQLEQLDARLVPSTISSAISIYHPGGILRVPWTERDWYTVDQGTGHVLEFKGTKRYDLAGPGKIVALSASVDPNTGTGEVFALSHLNVNSGPFTIDAGLWLCDSNGAWHSFEGWYAGPYGFPIAYDDYGGISATHDGHVYAVRSDGANIDYFDSNGFSSHLGAPNAGNGSWAGNSLAASDSRSGTNEVFAIGPGLAIYVNTGTPGQWQLVDNSTKFVTLSASPNDTVFAVTWDGFGGPGKLYEETEQLGFQGGKNYYYYWAGKDISVYGHVYGTISADLDASGQAEVYAIDELGNLSVYDQGSWTWKTSGPSGTGGVYDVAGADGGDFYVVYYESGKYAAYQFDPSFWLGDGLL
jgi:hypothetical protein